MIYLFMFMDSENFTCSKTQKNIYFNTSQPICLSLSLFFFKCNILLLSKILLVIIWKWKITCVFFARVYNIFVIFYHCFIHTIHALYIYIYIKFHDKHTQNEIFVFFIFISKRYLDVFECLSFNESNLPINFTSYINLFHIIFCSILFVCLLLTIMGADRMKSRRSKNFEKKCPRSVS